MSSSFNSSSSVGAVFDNLSPYSRLCNCKSKMIIQISKQPKSYARRFFSCPNGREGVGGCGFFLWFDPPEDNNVRNEIDSSVILKCELVELKKAMEKAMENVSSQIMKLNVSVEVYQKAIAPELKLLKYVVFLMFFVAVMFVSKAM
ncbi:hypothetical protein ACFE04_005727 [Oxalis oulophora]